MRRALLAPSLLALGTIVTAEVLSCGPNPCRLDLTPKGGGFSAQVDLNASITCNKGTRVQSDETVAFTSSPSCACNGSDPCSLCPASERTNSSGNAVATLVLKDRNRADFQVTVTASSTDGSDSASYVLNPSSPAPSTTTTPTTTPTQTASSTPVPTATPCNRVGTVCVP